MTVSSDTRWINTLIAESEGTLPVLPWERAAKRARRARMDQDLAESATA